MEQGLLLVLEQQLLEEAQLTLLAVERKREGNVPRKKVIKSSLSRAKKAYNRAKKGVTKAKRRRNTAQIASAGLAGTAVYLVGKKRGYRKGAKAGYRSGFSSALQGYERDIPSSKPRYRVKRTPIGLSRKKR